jgi:hypothetical protein
VKQPCQVRRVPGGSKYTEDLSLKAVNFFKVIEKLIQATGRQRHGSKLIKGDDDFALLFKDLAEPLVIVSTGFHDGQYRANPIQRSSAHVFPSSSSFTHPAAALVLAECLLMSY